MDSSKSKTKDLVDLRERIDAIDDEIIALLIKRIELANSIMKSKASSQIVDSKREQEIITRYSAKLSNVSTPSKSKRFVQALIATSNRYPEP